MKGLTKQHFTLRCKLRGTVLEAVVMNKDTDDVFVLSWDLSTDTVKVGDKTEKTDSDAKENEVSDNSELQEDILLEQSEGGR